MEEQLEDYDRDLLKFNYENLHESVWENHRTSWIVTSIFIPIIFAMQGYFIKDYFSTLNSAASETATVQVFMGALVIQSLTVVWWLIMKIFGRYNEVRFNRLREIEEIFRTRKMKKDDYPVRQYMRMGYTLYLFAGKDGKKRPDDEKRQDEKRSGLKMTFDRVYDLVLAETVVVNILLILYSM